MDRLRPTVSFFFQSKTISKVPIIKTKCDFGAYHAQKACLLTPFHSNDAKFRQVGFQNVCQIYIYIFYLIHNLYKIRVTTASLNQLFLTAGNGYSLFELELICNAAQRYMQFNPQDVLILAITKFGYSTPRKTTITIHLSILSKFTSCNKIYWEMEIHSLFFGFITNLLDQF